MWEQLEARVISSPPLLLHSVLIQPVTINPTNATQSFIKVCSSCKEDEGSWGRFCVQRWLYLFFNSRSYLAALWCDLIVHVKWDWVLSHFCCCDFYFILVSLTPCNCRSHKSGLQNPGPSDIKDGRKMKEGVVAWTSDTFEWVGDERSGGLKAEEKWDRVTDCYSRLLAPWSCCTAWHHHRSRKMNFPTWAPGFKVIYRGKCDTVVYLII